MNIVLDANAIIYWLEGEPALSGAVAARLAHHLAPPSAVLGISALSLLECRVHPLRHGRQAVLDRYERFFQSPDLRVVTLDAGVMAIAANLRAHHGLKTPDALQAACCLSLGSSHLFVTADHGFGRVPGLQVDILDFAPAQ